MRLTHVRLSWNRYVPSRCPNSRNSIFPFASSGGTNSFAAGTQFAMPSRQTFQGQCTRLLRSNSIS